MVFLVMLCHLVEWHKQYWHMLYFSKGMYFDFD